MRLLFLGAIHDALQDALRDLGHDTYAPADTDWYLAQQSGISPQQYAAAAWAVARSVAPDAVVLPKGWHFRQGVLWAIPDALPWALRRMCRCLVYVCHDDPAATPITLSTKLAEPADLWLTTCPGIADLFPLRQQTAAEVHEWWLAWDHRIPQPVAPRDDTRVDVAFTGSPYYRPFPEPHYQGGFSVPRRELVRACIEAGFRVGVWGPDTWIDADSGGDPAFASVFRGWVQERAIHEVHASARCVVATHLVEGKRYDSGRLPFILGAGGVVVHEERPGLREEFGECVAWFPPGHVSVVVERVRWLLEHPAQRDQMARDGQAIVLARHTWRHRAERLIELVSARIARQAAAHS